MTNARGLSPAATKTPRSGAAHEPWPGAEQPVRLLAAIADWLAGYGNVATRRTYATGLGLPAGPEELADWATLGSGPPGWGATVDAYGAVLGLDPRTPTPTVTRRPPPAAPGKLRELHWLRWCAAHRIDPLAAHSAHVKAWLDELATAEAARTTRERMLATLKALYAHLAETGLTSGNPAAINRRRLGLSGNRETGHALNLTVEQVRALYTAAATPRRGASTQDTARATTVVALLTLGLRVSEMCALNRSDLHTTRGRRALRVPGKGDKPRIVYLPESVEITLTDYLHTRDSMQQSNRPAPRGQTLSGPQPLLSTRSGRRCSRQGLWQLLRRLAATSPELHDIAEALHPHALRHFYVTTAVEAGAALADVQADLGHTSIATTQSVYNHAARHPERSAADLVATTLQSSTEVTDPTPEPNEDEED
ncbi:Site-specific recombinase XerD [Actinopolyspora mzabensis]|uniref:Site-specific recombinase XerD n=1 Tax=Actinopolyspora mzabensis TaxID=995066 RepID=A0A1G8Y8R3_ACTMZ|nr:tyrosine-type recombinase/integrase [Actinopolyspora mzabensis]SDJ98794.1 Site-specific recombinase XerD [Actinopolyspora mzabensis]